MHFISDTHKKWKHRGKSLCVDVKLFWEECLNIQTKPGNLCFCFQWTAFIMTYHILNATL